MIPLPERKTRKPTSSVEGEVTSTFSNHKRPVNSKNNECPSSYEKIGGRRRKKEQKKVSPLLPSEKVSCCLSYLPIDTYFLNETPTLFFGARRACKISYIFCIRDLGFSAWDFKLAGISWQLEGWFCYFFLPSSLLGSSDYQRFFCVNSYIYI